jgi:ribonuclease P protein subunit POP4
MKTADLARHELIGLDVTFAGRSGRIVDETKHTFVVETAAGAITVPKAGRSFRFVVDGKNVEVEGDEIMFQPEDRTKKVRS